LTDTNTQLQSLFELTVEALHTKVKSGEATAADFNVIRQFLKDNGIDAIPTKGNGLGKLATVLPFQTAEQLAENAS